MVSSRLPRTLINGDYSDVRICMLLNEFYIRIKLLIIKLLLLLSWLLRMLRRNEGFTS